VQHRAMHLQGEDLYYTNFSYDPACYYFLYIGELKAYGLNQFVREALQKRVPAGTSGSRRSSPMSASSTTMTT